MYHAINKLLNVSLLLASLCVLSGYCMQSPEGSTHSGSPPPYEASGTSSQQLQLLPLGRPPEPSGYYQTPVSVVAHPQQRSDHACRSILCLCTCLFGSGSCTGCFLATAVSVTVLFASDICESIQNLASNSHHSPVEQPLISAIDPEYPDRNAGCPANYNSIGTLKTFADNTCHLADDASSHYFLNSTLIRNTTSLSVRSKVLKSICLNDSNVSLCMHTWGAKLFNSPLTDLQHLASQLDRFTKKGSVIDDGSTTLLKVVEGQMCERMSGTGF